MKIRVVYFLIVLSRILQISKSMALLNYYKFVIYYYPNNAFLVLNNANKIPAFKL